ncbi:hypothetical protein Pcinc_020930 [Petrolisthes cinctipes]|uniref:Glutathione S-transferase 3, mitochondrial n=1 Tax=Petrolisthes cinctipes TaxID=88211 RepID=A0AAE1FGX5_PETCI|nr:hypothetical protein Pcinc_020930 [Petrolisthes cinctipes]
MVSINVPAEYGYVVLVAICSILMIQWKALKVYEARRAFKIPYPTVYYKTHNDLFNCYQRAHQNTLENYPQFLVLLLVGGLHNPVVSAVGGAIWCMGRVVYAYGYYTGDPSRRNNGVFGYIGIIAQLYCTVRFAAGLLNWF